VDAVVASASSLVPYLRRPALRDVPAVVDLVDVDSQKWLDYSANSAGPASWLYRLEGTRLRRVETQLSSWARALTLVSEAEAAVYRGFCGSGRVEVAVNGVDLEYFQPVEQPTQPACVFVGALDYRPNVDAACWFCREVWPHIQQRLPRAEMWLVGRQPVAAVRQLGRLPGVQLIGQVPDVRPYLARASVAVVPLRLARGVQNKVLEALAMAKAVVASPPALAALDVQPGVHLLAASSPAQWEEAVVSLLEDENQRRSLGAAGRAFVETHHYWDRCLERFARLLELPAGMEQREADAVLAGRRSA
jgi:sugar transferase (PEP-CTERM/EpsH1 system associated)